MSKRKAPTITQQPQKKVKHTRDIQLPSLISIPQGYKGPGDKPKLGQVESVQRLRTADVPMPLFNKAPEQPPPQRTQPPHSARSQRAKPQSADITTKLHQFNLPQQYKEVLGDDIEQLKQYAKRKAKKEKAIQDLIKQGKIQIVKREKTAMSEESVDQIMMTEDGKLRNTKGNIVILKENKTSLLVNQQKKKEQKLKDVLRKQKQLKEAINERGKYYDRNLSVSLFGNTGKRQKHKILALNFVEKEKGSLAASLDINATEEPNEMEIEGQKQFQAGFKRVAVKIKHYDPIPNIEWWDTELLPAEQGNYIPLEAIEQAGVKQPTTSHTQEEVEQNMAFMEGYEFQDKDLKLDRVTHFVEHPEPFKVSDIVQARERAAIPIYLTKKERKRLTRRKRAEAEKDKQDRVRLGLQQPDPPKIKLSNMMRILGTEAVIDPSKAEKEVRRQMQERYDKHVKDNEARKLTKEQKGEKMKKKWDRDAAQEIRMAVFRVEDLSDPSVRFKVNMNAQQVGLQGVCLVSNPLCQVPSLVVVEGGPKGIKFYKKLLLNRIKWDQLRTNESQPSGCSMIWEGVQKQHSFNRWRTIEMKSEADGRLALAEKNMEHFWDLAMKNQQQ